MQGSGRLDGSRGFGWYALAALVCVGCENKPPSALGMADEAPGICALPEEAAPLQNAPAPCADEAEPAVAGRPAAEAVTDSSTPASCCGAPSCRGPQSGCSCGGDHIHCEG